MQPSSDQPAGAGRQLRRYGPLVAILVVGAVIAGVLVVTGGDDDDEQASTTGDVSDVELPEGVISYEQAEADGRLDEGEGEPVEAPVWLGDQGKHGGHRQVGEEVTDHRDEHAPARPVVQPHQDDLEREDPEEVVVPGNRSEQHQRGVPHHPDQPGDEQHQQGSVSYFL
jgi:hypothetical protein